MYRSLILATYCVFLFLLSFGQNNTLIKGRVVDSVNDKPLAFVHIVPLGHQQGTMTDIDGLFSLKLPQGVEKIQLSYVGYYTKKLAIDLLSDFSQVSLVSQNLELEEFVFFAGENPAHRIIRNTISHRNRNHPERLSSFSYHSYNKMVGTFEKEAIQYRWDKTGDSTFYNMKRFFEERHFFLLESVTEKKFRYPNQTNEMVLANRVSGFQNPTFSMLATELQSFSFYDAFITLLEQPYLSPLNSIAFRNYFYALEDTLYQAQDTVFVVSYRPFARTNFNGLEGLLYINNRHWALQNVIARPNKDVNPAMQFQIQQKYDEVESGTWFPVQLNTDMTLRLGDDNSPASLPPIYLFSRSYFTNIRVNPPLSARDFSIYSIDFHSDANSRDSVFWNGFRRNQLGLIEENTYSFVDSVGKERNLDRLFTTIEPLAFGDIPWGWFNLPINRLYSVNAYEGHRLGAGLQTNRRFSDFFELSAYYAYGTRDKMSKYGGAASVLLHKPYALRLGGQWNREVHARGETRFQEKAFLLNQDFIRSVYIQSMDVKEETELFVAWRQLRAYLNMRLSYSFGQAWWLDDYVFTTQSSQLQAIDFSRWNIGFRLAVGEKLMNTPNREITFPGSWPVLYMNVERGSLMTTNFQADYFKLDGRLDIQYNIPLWGKQAWMIEGGYVSRQDLPLSFLYNARSGNKKGWVAAPFSFGTMHLDELYASAHVSVFFQHNFGSLLFRTERYSPEFLLLHNAGVGFGTQDRVYHKNWQGRYWEHPYLEGGFAFNKILPSAWVSSFILAVNPGLEMLYRYGYYTYPNRFDNLTIKMSLVLSM